MFNNNPEIAAAMGRIFNIKGEYIDPEVNSYPLPIVDIKQNCEILINPTSTAILKQKFRVTGYEMSGYNDIAGNGTGIRLAIEKSGHIYYIDHYGTSININYVFPTPIDLSKGDSLGTAVTAGIYTSVIVIVYGYYLGD